MPTIWDTLLKPIFTLAPMEDVTDTVFRQIISSQGPALGSQLFFTEFVSTDALFSKGKEDAMKRLLFTKKEKPIIAQIWGNNPLLYTKTAHIIVELGFDGIDINLGCPDRNIVKKGCCSGLMHNLPLVSEIIAACKKGAGKLPVSVKTRLGYNKIETERWIGFLLSQDLSAITVHGRIATQMSRGRANWEEIGKAVTMRNRMKKKTYIIGNGDVNTIKEAREKVRMYGVDGVMLGRAIFQNPWLFNPSVDPQAKTSREKLAILLAHLRLFDATWGKKKHFDGMKKFYKMYVEGFKGAHALRIKLMSLKTARETIDYIEKLIG